MGSKKQLNGTEHTIHKEKEMDKLAIGTKSSIRIDKCQVCSSPHLDEIISLGHIPQVNVMQQIGSDLQEEVFFPAELLQCQTCSLVQISHIVDPEIIFPPSYAYTSRTTKILRDNFKNLAEEAEKIVKLKPSDLVVDIGSNDGTLLRNFTKFKVQGVEPTDVAQYANEQGIPTIQSFFNAKTADAIVVKHDRHAKLVTAANVFAHIEDIHSIVQAIKTLIGKDGVFISESHYLMGLIKTNQYDTIYHEHLRYYSLTSIKYLLEMHGLEVFNVQFIPTHGSSIRVYAANKGQFAIDDSVTKTLNAEKLYLTKETFTQFKKNIIQSKIKLYSLLDSLQGSIGAIGAPSRASTLVNYIGLNEDIIQFVLEAPGSNKIDKYMPGTKIPVLQEKIELLTSVDNLLLLSWHIADEMMPKIRDKGFRGKFVTPLPFPGVL
jgi:C-methyltransferase-like protein/methyltransferase family protein/putative zinc binding protein